MYRSGPPNRIRTNNCIWPETGSRTLPSSWLVPSVTGTGKRSGGLRHQRVGAEAVFSLAAGHAKPHDQHDPPGQWDISDQKPPACFVDIVQPAHHHGRSRQKQGQTDFQREKRDSAWRNGGANKLREYQRYKVEQQKVPTLRPACPSRERGVASGQTNCYRFDESHGFASLGPGCANSKFRHIALVRRLS